MSAAPLSPAEAGYHFPPGFLWGTETAAYQIEGAASADGRVALYYKFCELRLKEIGSEAELAVVNPFGAESFDNMRRMLKSGSAI